MRTRDGEPIGDENARPGDAISVRLLGPFAVAVGERSLPLTAGKLRAMVSVLALSAGQAVTVDRFATALWAGEDPPVKVRRSVQTYLTRLRSVLGPASITSTPLGYVLNADPEQIDVLRFVRLLDGASDASDSLTTRARLAEALDLWRGRPFEGVPSIWLQESEAPWLTERYLSALERRLDLDISMGRHEELVVELSELTARHPLRESLWARLLIVLNGSGRRADALARYETIRVRIASEFGVDPHPSLQRIHVDLLAEDAAEPRPAPLGRGRRSAHVGSALR